MDNSNVPRPVLTPGRLYAMLSAEFRESRPRTCLACAMPMVFACERAHGGGANWSVEAPAFRCDRCEAEIARIVRKYAAIYDLHDLAAARPA